MIVRVATFRRLRYKTASTQGNVRSWPDADPLQEPLRIHEILNLPSSLGDTNSQTLYRSNVGAAHFDHDD